MRYEFHVSLKVQQFDDRGFLLGTPHLVEKEYKLPDNVPPTRLRSLLDSFLGLFDVVLK